MNTGHKSKIRWSEIRGIIYRPELYNLQTRKKSEQAQIVQIELLINSNTKSSQI